MGWWGREKSRASERVREQERAERGTRVFFFFLMVPGMCQNAQGEKKGRVSKTFAAPEAKEAALKRKEQREAEELVTCVHSMPVI